MFSFEKVVIAIICGSFTFFASSAQSVLTDVDYKFVSTYYDRVNFGARGLTTDVVGNLYFAQSNYHIICKIDKATNISKIVAGTSVADYNGDNILATNAMLNIPTDVVVDFSGNFYIADSNNALIRKVSVTTRILTNFAGNRINGFSGDNGLASSASIGQIFSLTIDPQQENIYFTATFYGKIRKVNLATNIITTFAGTGLTTFNGENVLISMVNIFYVSCVRFDASGDFLFYIDYFNTRIRKINMKTNIVSTIAGNGVSGYNGDDIQATSARISNALSLTIDQFRNVYFSDTYNNRVRKVDSNTGFFFFFLFFILYRNFTLFCTHKQTFHDFKKRFNKNNCWNW
jgi:hypothetical protein